MTHGRMGVTTRQSSLRDWRIATLTYPALKTPGQAQMPLRGSGIEATLTYPAFGPDGKAEHLFTGMYAAKKSPWRKVGWLFQ